MLVRAEGLAARKTGNHFILMETALSEGGGKGQRSGCRSIAPAGIAHVTNNTVTIKMLQGTLDAPCVRIAGTVHQRALGCFRGAVADRIGPNEHHETILVDRFHRKTLARKRKCVETDEFQIHVDNTGHLKLKGEG
jgi:hypothetical protein